MNSNYEWQKFAAKDRIDGYRLQAEANRQVKRNTEKGKESGSAMNKVGFAFAIGILLFTIAFILTGCQFGAVPAIEAMPESISEVSIGERILFHDQLQAKTEMRQAGLVSSLSDNGLSMAERIHFHDKLQANAALNIVQLASSRFDNGLSMGERIAFHDQLLANAELNNTGQNNGSTPTAMKMAGRIRFQDRVQR